MKTVRFFRITLTAVVGIQVIFCSIVIILLMFPLANHPNRISFLKLQYKCKNCSVAKELAREDFKNDKYWIIVWGFFEDVEFEELVNIFTSDYKIQPVGGGGCMMDWDIECYNEEMRYLLSEKFGNCFYENAMDKVEGNVKERLITENEK